MSDDVEGRKESSSIGVRYFSYEGGYYRWVRVERRVATPRRRPGDAD